MSNYTNKCLTSPVDYLSVITPCDPCWLLGDSLWSLFWVSEDITEMIPDKTKNKFNQKQPLCLLSSMPDSTETEMLSSWNRLHSKSTETKWNGIGLPFNCSKNSPTLVWMKEIPVREWHQTSEKQQGKPVELQWSKNKRFWQLRLPLRIT